MSHCPRILIAAPHSGAGKSTLTVALLAALRSRGQELAAFKCGPDQIDPLFHREALGLTSYQLDAYFCTPPELESQLIRYGAGKLSLIEGVMGYYDGIGSSDLASSYQVARATHTPVVMVLDGKGAMLSLAATLQGFRDFRPDAGLRGVIFNRVPGYLREHLQMVAEEAGLVCLGCLPKIPQIHWPERQLGLYPPSEIESFQAQLPLLAELMESHVDLEALLQLAESAPELPLGPEKNGFPEEQEKTSVSAGTKISETAEEEVVTDFEADPAAPPLVLAYAHDEAFYLHYGENLDILRASGFRLVPFSPCHDPELPEATAAIWLDNGAPEYHAAALARNQAMQESLRQAVARGVPCVALGGAVLYLAEKLDGAAMCGIIPGKAHREKHMPHFGYATLSSTTETLLLGAGESLRTREHRYYALDDEGSAYQLQKAVAPRTFAPAAVWREGFASPSLYAAFADIYLPGCPQAAARLYQAARRYRARQTSEEK